MRGEWGRRHLLLGGAAIAALALWVLLAAPALGADPVDTTPPTGTLTINDGSGWSNSLELTLHVPATDDVGVVSVQVFQDGVPGPIVPYADTIQYTLSPDKGDYAYTIYVWWRDAAGNAASSGSKTVTVDRQAPVIGQVRQLDDPDETDMVKPVSITSGDGWPIAAVRLSSDGSTWSDPIPWAASIDWHFLDPAQGGSPKLGFRRLYAQAIDAAGNVSAVVSERVYIAVSAPIQVSPDVPATGHTITLTPKYPAAVTFPSGTHCYWEVMWGDNQSLYYGNRDETFGFFYIYGPASGGYCDPLSFTLPWMQYPRMMIHYRVEPTTDGNAAVDEYIGGSPEEPAIVPVIDSTNRHITASSIPLVYVLPESYTLIAGQPTTYRAYAVGGAKITDKDMWAVDYGDYPLQKLGGTSFTFVPRTTGYLTVCWGTDTMRMTRWSACYDPRVRHPDYYRPNTTPPVQRIAGGEYDGQVPVKLTWNGSDTGWGIAKYQLQRSVDGGAWKRVLSKRVKTITQQLATGHRYRYRVRAIDKAGNKGYWDYGPTFRVKARGDSSSAITYRGTWSTIDDATATGGVLHEAEAAGARAIITFKGRDIALVVPRGPALGRVSVYVDGRLLKTLDLSSAADQPRRILVRRHWSSVGTHRIKVVVEGTLDRPAVDLDGFLVLR